MKSAYPIAPSPERVAVIRWTPAVVFGTVTLTEKAPEASAWNGTAIDVPDIVIVPVAFGAKRVAETLTVEPGRPEYGDRVTIG